MVYICVFPLFSLPNTMIEKFETCINGLSDMVATYKVLPEGKIELTLKSYKKERFSGAFWFLQANFEEIRAIKRIDISRMWESITYAVKMSNGQISDYMYDGSLIDVNSDGSCLAEVYGYSNKGFDDGHERKPKTIKIKKGLWYRNTEEEKI